MISFSLKVKDILEALKDVDPEMYVFYSGGELYDLCKMEKSIIYGTEVILIE